jgi:hypothetical protein
MDEKFGNSKWVLGTKGAWAEMKGYSLADVIR